MLNYCMEAVMHCLFFTWRVEFLALVFDFSPGLSDGVPFSGLDRVRCKEQLLDIGGMLLLNSTAMIYRAWTWNAGATCARNSAGKVVRSMFLTYQVHGKTEKGGKKTTVWCTLCKQTLHKTGFSSFALRSGASKTEGSEAPDLRPVNSGLRANNERNARRSRRNQRGNK